MKNLKMNKSKIVKNFFLSAIVTVFFVKAVTNVFAEGIVVKIPSDLLADNNTQNTEVYSVEKTDGVVFEGLLDVTPIRNQMEQTEREMKEKYENYKAGLGFLAGALPPFESVIKQVDVKDMNFSMTARLLLPTSMKFKEEPTKDNTKLIAKLGGQVVEGGFEIESVELIPSTPDKGEQLVVTMVLRDNNTTMNYGELREKVFSQDELCVKATEATFADEAIADTNYVVYGVVKGTFEGTPNHPLAGSPFGSLSYIFDSEQMPDGRDSTRPVTGTESDNETTLTLKFTNPAVAQKTTKWVDSVTMADIKAPYVGDDFAEVGVVDGYTLESEKIEGDIKTFVMKANPVLKPVPSDKPATPAAPSKPARTVPNTATK